MSKRKKLFITALTLPVLLLLALSVAVPLMLDSSAIKQQLADTLKAQYQLNLESKSDGSVNAFPSPQVTFTNNKITDENGAQVALVPSITLDIGWQNLFSGQLHSITLHEPDIDITTKAQLKQFTKMNEEPHNVYIQNATLTLTPATISASYFTEPLTLDKVNISLTHPNEQSSAISASLMWKGKTLSANITQNKSDLSLNLTASLQDLLNLEFNGTKTSEFPLWQGDVKAELTNVFALTKWISQSQQTEEKEENTPVPSYPLSITSTATLSSQSIMIHRSSAKFNQIKAEAAFYLGWQNFVNVALALYPETMQLDKFVQDFAPFLLPDTEYNRASVIPVVTKALPDSLAMVVQLQVNEPKIASKTYDNFTVTAEFAQENTYLHHASMQMPGNANLTLDGMIQQLPEGRRFSGVAELQGEQFNQWLANFEPLAINLPEEDFSDFSFAGNLFISKEQLRLSEAALKIGELDFQGGFATFFDTIPRVEAEIKLSDINLDYIRDIWRKKSAGNNSLMADLTEDTENFSWLKRLPAILDLRINIEDFTFFDTRGQTLTTRLYSKPGELLLSGLDMRLVNNVINSNLRFNVMGRKPLLEMVIIASRFDTDYFATEEEKESIPFVVIENGKADWSTELWNFKLINTMNGSIDASIGSLIHNGEAYENFKTLAVLENEELNIKKLSFTIYDGTFETAGKLIGGSVPGLSATFALYNGNLNTILQEFFDLEGITGRVSLSGNVGTSGIHPKAWLEQGDANISAAARGVRVKNFNLQGMIDSAREARSTVDVKTAANERLFDGVTELSVDGNINIKRGQMKTPGLRLGYEQAIGGLVGELNLLLWSMNVASNWQFPQLSSSTVPTLSISIQGGINDARTRVDTSSLEAFVAKRIVGQ